MAYEIFAKKEADGWADPSIIDAYISGFGPVTDAAGAAIMERVSLKGQAVLDLCCGHGALTGKLVEAGAQVSGLDFSEKMLHHAARNAPGADLRKGDAAALPFADESFDVVICNFGMMHLPDQPSVLREIRRVLKPAGFFAMATWMTPDANPAFGIVYGGIRANADMSNAPPQPDLFAFAKIDTARQMMKDAGLSLTSQEIVTPVWNVQKPEDFLDIFLEGTVGAAMLIKGQKADVQKRIRDHIVGKVADVFQSANGYAVPVAVAVNIARPIL